jgi:methylmalonyl-CoA mutase
MDTYLFNEFQEVNPQAWKAKIQVDLKGLDYNETLLWKTNEGITVKPFYTQEDRTNTIIPLSKTGFNICQTISISNEKKANTIAVRALQKGANSIFFTAKKTFDFHTVLSNIDFKKTILFFKLDFLSEKFILQLTEFIHSKHCFFYIDIIGNFASSGNWHTNLKGDFQILEKISKSTANSIGIDTSLYQNAGANITQQLAYALAHANEYLNYFGGEIASKIHFNFSVGSNYFFEIAKLRAFRLLWDTLLKEYDTENKDTHIIAQPTLRNKTLYDYNINMLRTTSEYMSAILGGATTISTISYDCLFHNSNEFGERIARNQLLILQQESNLGNTQHIADGTYYIEVLTKQLAQKSLEIFKQIENGGGFLQQLKEGVIQRKITESANKEQEQFNTKELILLGTNKMENKMDIMHSEIEVYPFLKMRPKKTQIQPIIRKRLAEKTEQERLQNEQKKPF